jgi:hypothetical protein
LVFSILLPSPDPLPHFSAQNMQINLASVAECKSGAGMNVERSNFVVEASSISNFDTSC